MSYDYTVSKVIDAPLSKVWTAWTTPEGNAAIFHAAPGAPVTADVRPGGRYELTMLAPDNSEVPMTGSYLEVVEGRRLVSVMDTPEGPSTPMTMDLEEVDGGTKVTFSQTCNSAEERDGSKEGSEILLEWVSDYVTK